LFFNKNQNEHFTSHNLRKYCHGMFDFLEAMSDKRRILGMNQDRAAEALGISQSRLSRLETGRDSWPQKLFDEYCSLLQLVPPGDLSDQPRLKISNGLDGRGAKPKPRELLHSGKVVVFLTEEEQQWLADLAYHFRVSRQEVFRQLLSAGRRELQQELQAAATRPT
jgi:transcriptional regulator with XRE-family HTH domain